MQRRGGGVDQKWRPKIIFVNNLMNNFPLQVFWRLLSPKVVVGRTRRNPVPPFRPFSGFICPHSVRACPTLSHYLSESRKRIRKSSRFNYSPPQILTAGLSIKSVSLLPYIVSVLPTCSISTISHFYVLQYFDLQKYLFIYDTTRHNNFFRSL